MELEGKIVIVTGGAAGIGKAIAMLFAEKGAKVTIADIRDDLVEQTAKELNDSGLSVGAMRVDVSVEAQAADLVKSVIGTHGGIDILVNNAGRAQNIPFLEMTEQEWDSLINVNMKGTFLCSRAAATEMVRQGHGGRIINIVSTAALNARPGASAYSASKAGLVQFTKVLALELGAYGITVNAVGPGLTLTNSPVTDAPTDEYQRAFVQQVPLGRTGTPLDIARTIAFLASDDASYITGQAIYVDGGYSAGKLSVQG